MFKLTNDGNNIRAIPGALGQVRVGPRQTISDVILEEPVAMALRRYELRGDKLHITSSDPIGQEILKRAETAPYKRGFSITGHPDAKQPVVEDQLIDKDNTVPLGSVDRDETLPPDEMKTQNHLAARELIEEATRMPLNELRAKARLLCKDWPGGQMSRPTVIAHLEKV